MLLKGLYSITPRKTDAADIHNEFNTELLETSEFCRRSKQLNCDNRAKSYNLDIKESNVESFKQLIKTPKKSVIARSAKQSEYIKSLKENICIIPLAWNLEKFIKTKLFKFNKNIKIINFYKK